MASGATDAPRRAFSFLTLPKELRLIVYEMLFESTIRTHKELTKNPRPWSPGLHPCLAQEHNKPVASVCIVQDAVPVAILATCRQVYAEGISTLQRALADIRQRPQKLVITTDGLRASYLVDLLDRLAHQSRNTLPFTNIDKDEILPTSEPIRVQIAVRNRYANRQLGDLGTAEELWSYLRLYILRLHYEGMLYEAEALRCKEEPCSARALDVTFHMALMSSTEKKECEVGPPFEKSTTWNEWTRLQIQGGEEIEVTEWENDWAASWTEPETVVQAPEERESGVTENIKLGSRLDKLICGAYARFKSLTKRWSHRRRSD